MVGLRSSADQDAGVLFLLSVSHGGILKRERLSAPSLFVSEDSLDYSGLYLCMYIAFAGSTIYFPTNKRRNSSILSSTVPPERAKKINEFSAR